LCHYAGVLRHCWIAIVSWIAVMALYAYVLREELPMPLLFFIAAVIGSLVWVGLMFLANVRLKFRDWRARARLARGEQPQDGDLVSATGEIRAAFEPLRSPVSGRECVLYSYDIGPPSGSEDSARDYAGFGMTRCTLYTPRGTFHLGSFPVFSGWEKQKGDRAHAEEHVRTATFEALDSVRAVTALVSGIYRETPPFHRDWRIGGTQGDVETADVMERLVVPGETVTVTGRYVSSRNEIVSDLRQPQGYLRLERGGRPMSETPALPWEAIRTVLIGLMTVAAAHTILWAVLQNVPR
jgi:hypothetical protein